jgi:hypothetical protein
VILSRFFAPTLATPVAVFTLRTLVTLTPLAQSPKVVVEVAAVRDLVPLEQMRYYGPALG